MVKNDIARNGRLGGRGKSDSIRGISKIQSILTGAASLQVLNPEKKKVNILVLGRTKRGIGAAH